MTPAASKPDLRRRTWDSDYAFVNALRAVIGLGPIPYTVAERDMSVSHALLVVTVARELWEAQRKSGYRSQWVHAPWWGP